MNDSIKKTLVRNLRRALNRKELTEEEAILERLRSEAPASVETRGFELELLLGAGRMREAGQLSRELIKLFPSSSRILYIAGQHAYRTL